MYPARQYALNLRSGRTVPPPPPPAQDTHHLPPQDAVGPSNAHLPTPRNVVPPPAPQGVPNHIPPTPATQARTHVPPATPSQNVEEMSQELIALRNEVEALRHVAANASRPNSDGAGPSGVNAPPSAAAPQEPPVGANDAQPAQPPLQGTNHDPMDMDEPARESEGEAVAHPAPRRDLPNRRVNLKLFPPKLPRHVTDPDVFVNHLRQLDNFLRQEPARENEYAFILQSIVSNNQQILEWVLEYLDNHPEHTATHCKELFLRTFAPMRKNRSEVEQAKLLNGQIVQGADSVSLYASRFMASSLKVPHLPESVKVSIFCKGLHTVLQYRSMHDPLTLQSFVTLDAAMAAALKDETQRVHEHCHRKAVAGVSMTHMTDAERVYAYYQGLRTGGGAGNARGLPERMAGNREHGEGSAGPARGAGHARGGPRSYPGVRGQGGAASLRNPSERSEGGHMQGRGGYHGPGPSAPRGSLRRAAAKRPRPNESEDGCWKCGMTDHFKRECDEYWARREETGTDTRARHSGKSGHPGQGGHREVGAGPGYPREGGYREGAGTRGAHVR